MGSKRPISRRQNIQNNVKSVWQYSRQVFAVSSVNGVSHVALAKSNGKRVLWICLFSIGLTGWFYQTSTLLEYYYKYPSIVKIQVEKPPIMDFPAFTICNVNRIRRSVLCKEFPDKCHEENIVLSEDDYFNVTFQFMKKGKKFDLGHQMKDMIVSCEFSGVPTLDTEDCMKYFAPYYDPPMGNCYVFSSRSAGRNRLYVSEPNAWQDKKDMELVLNVEHDEYLDNETVTPGLILTLHEDGSYPHILAHGVHVYADHTYSLSVEKMSVNLLPKPFGTNCTDYSELPFHSVSEMELSPRICTVECLLYHQERECPHSYVTDNVVLYSEKMPYDPDEITAGDKRCADLLSESYKEFCSSLCGVPCQLLSRLQISSAHADTHLLCGGIPGLAKRQREMCEKHPDILFSVSKGARIGVAECQAQFRNQRWNCSTLETGASVFGNHMLKVDSRESAFLYAISSAGVTHAIIRSCSRGEIPNCPCDPVRKKISSDYMGKYSWSGCSHLNAGMRYSRQFIDATETHRRDSRALMNFHNNRAGRKAVQKKAPLQCKCHGVSGSCTSMTCWEAKVDFRDVGKFLKKKYEGSVQVTMSNQQNLVSVEGRKPFIKMDLIYFEPSPDYCTMNKTMGTLGTGGRRCLKNSKGADGCNIMCCGRGYDTKRELIINNKCSCKFNWCCDVKCEVCKEWKDVYTCKMPHNV